MPDYDVLVAGGGPAGAITALVLARSGRRVLLADRGRPPAARLGETLPPVARRLLGDLGLWEEFLECDPLASHGSGSVWGSPRLESSNSIFDPDGPGWRVDRGRFDAFLQAAAARAGTDVRAAAGVRRLERHEDGWAADLAGPADAGGAVRFGWLVDATGRGAALVRGHGADLRRWDRLVATVATFGPAAGDEDGRTLVEAVPDGWWYTALLPGGDRTFGFLTDADLAPAELRNPAGFLAHADRSRHVRALLARCSRVPAGPPRRVSANGGRLHAVHGPGWVAVGDAALAVDPLSAQGMLTALHSGLVAGQALQARLERQLDALDGYQASVDAISAAYQRNHRDYYRLETRWPQAPFWRRRHGW